MHPVCQDFPGIKDTKDPQGKVDKMDSRAHQDQQDLRDLLEQTGQRASKETEGPLVVQVTKETRVTQALPVTLVLLA